MALFLYSHYVALQFQLALVLIVTFHDFKGFQRTNDTENVMHADYSTFKKLTDIIIVCLVRFEPAILFLQIYQV